MPNKKLPIAYDKYGASMGRRSHTMNSQKEAPYKFSLQRIRLDQGGYDNGGAYWGIGKPLYHAEAVDTPEVEALNLDELPDFYFRAYDRDDAKEQVKEKYPNAKFYR